MSQHKYIVVEGPIGVGKTSLARRLSETFSTELLLEEGEDNPFLEKFYKDPRQAALPTQLFFLFQRTQKIQALRQSDFLSPVHVADFLMEKDRLFAQLNLDDDELRLYEQAYESLTLDAPQPDLVIYLQAPAEVLESRITRRGRECERTITTEYLRGVVDAYAQMFHYYDAAPLLIVNATEIDPVNNEHDYQALLDRIKTIRSGRHYFNPLPIAL